MTKQKTKTTKAEKPKKNTNLRPAIKFLSMVSSAVVAYTGIDYLLRSTNEPTAIIVAFALIWVVSDVAIYFYNYMVKPSAEAIAKSK